MNKSTSPKPEPCAHRKLERCSHASSALEAGGRPAAEAVITWKDAFACTILIKYVARHSMQVFSSVQILGDNLAIALFCQIFSIT